MVIFIALPILFSIHTSPKYQPLYAYISASFVVCCNHLIEEYLFVVSWLFTFKVFDDLFGGGFAKITANISLSILPLYIVVFKLLFLTQMPHHASNIRVVIVDEPLFPVVIVIHRRQCFEQFDVFAAVNQPVICQSFED